MPELRHKARHNPSELAAVREADELRDGEGCQSYDTKHDTIPASSRPCARPTYSSCFCLEATKRRSRLEQLLHSRSRSSFIHQIVRAWTRLTHAYFTTIS